VKGVQAITTANFAKPKTYSCQEGTTRKDTGDPCITQGAVRKEIETQNKKCKGSSRCKNHRGGSDLPNTPKIGLKGAYDWEDNNQEGGI